MDHIDHRRVLYCDFVHPAECLPLFGAVKGPFRRVESGVHFFGAIPHDVPERPGATGAAEERDPEVGPWGTVGNISRIKVLVFTKELVVARLRATLLRRPPDRAVQHGVPLNGDNLHVNTDFLEVPLDELVDNQG